MYNSTVYHRARCCVETVLTGCMRVEEPCVTVHIYNTGLTLVGRVLEPEDDHERNEDRQAQFGPHHSMSPGCSHVFCCQTGYHCSDFDIT